MRKLRLKRVFSKGPSQQPDRPSGASRSTPPTFLSHDQQERGEDEDEQEPLQQRQQDQRQRQARRRKTERRAKSRRRRHSHTGDYVGPSPLGGRFRCVSKRMARRFNHLLATLNEDLILFAITQWHREVWQPYIQLLIERMTSTIRSAGPVGGHPIAAPGGAAAPGGVASPGGAAAATTTTTTTATARPYTIVGAARSALNERSPSVVADQPIDLMNPGYIRALRDHCASASLTRRQAALILDVFEPLYDCVTLVVAAVRCDGDEVSVANVTVNVQSCRGEWRHLTDDGPKGADTPSCSEPPDKVKPFSRWWHWSNGQPTRIFVVLSHEGYPYTIPIDRTSKGSAGHSFRLTLIGRAVSNPTGIISNNSSSSSSSGGNHSGGSSSSSDAASRTCSSSSSFSNENVVNGYNLKANCYGATGRATATTDTTAGSLVARVPRGTKPAATGAAPVATTGKFAAIDKFTKAIMFVNRAAAKVRQYVDDDDDDAAAARRGHLPEYRHVPGVPDCNSVWTIAIDCAFAAKPTRKVRHLLRPGVMQRLFSHFTTRRDRRRNNHNNMQRHASSTSSSSSGSSNSTSASSIISATATPTTTTTTTASNAMPTKQNTTERKGTRKKALR